MQVDFYQLGSASADQPIAGIASKLLDRNGRLLIVAEEEAILSRLDRLLWDQGSTSFLPHAVAGGADDARQPILLSTTCDSPNLARNLLIADGLWRDAALSFERAFFLFDDSTLKAARLAWKLLSGREGVERRYWARDEDGRWAQRA